MVIPSGLVGSFGKHSTAADLTMGVSGRSLRAFAAAMLLSVGFGLPSLAADPFRSGASPMGAKTGEAFELIFKKSDYKAAQALLKQVETREASEPLMYTLQALLAFNNTDDKNWSLISTYADQTETAAKGLSKKGDKPSQLRGNLYLAMADFLDGAYAITQDGPVRGMSAAFGKMRGIYGSMKKARTIDANDPELNLVQGFLDMMMAIYLPLSDSKAAIQKLESVRDTNLKAAYLANWALATGYRTMKDNDQALAAINAGLKDQPNHAEMNYLKAQILAAQGKRAEAQPLFTKALQASATMPDNLVAQIFYEACKNVQSLDSKSRACDPQRDAIRDDKTDPWGPPVSTLPKL
ncbi:MAG: tetratricopeptide repeat protein [Synechococcales cyanobacterium RU_4_20]|nr:tetratricopeptide repeat protein [Synechococcales cyanobacterium RU_4_20]NJR67981.1 tetratricopeptide repeat protein [Synechococcales cyanobacterium CRU_2_2]